MPTAYEQKRATRARHKKSRERFRRVRLAGKKYERQLRAAAKQVGMIIDGFAPGGVVADMPALQAALDRYAQVLAPWARNVSEQMAAEVDQRDENAWVMAAREMGQEIRRELKERPVGGAVRALLDEQVALITSLPLQAGQRVHRLTMEGLANATRAKETAAEILKSGHVTESRAMLIARTETGRTASVLTEARAVSIGSEGYIWTSSADSDVRELHRELNGKFIRWDDPPIAGERGERAHAGAIYNCFVGEVPLSLRNGLRKIWKSRYDGQVVDISAGGVKFSLTPNHPILTLRGWVPAGQVHLGDNLVQVVSDAVGVVNQNEDDSFPSFHEVFETFKANHQAHPAVHFDFHGHVPDGEVHEVSPDTLLAYDGSSDTLQALCDFALPNPDSRIVDFVVVGGSDHVIETLCARIRDQYRTGLGAKIGHSDPVSSAAVPAGDSSRDQDSSDGPSVGTVLSGDGEFAHSGLVIRNDLGFRKVCAQAMARRRRSGDYEPIGPEALAEVVRVHGDCEPGGFDRVAGRYQPLRIVDIGLRDFSGHVFTIESENGWYCVTPAEIIAKNCRCYPQPVLPDVIR